MTINGASMGLVLAGMLIAGCARVAAPARTVSYFRAHPRTLAAVWQRCANDPGDLGRTPECVNARQAEISNSIGSFRHLPPMRFPAPDRQAGARATPGASGH